MTAVNSTATLETKGTIVHEIAKYESLPIGHTVVKGVDLWDGT